MNDGYLFTAAMTISLSHTIASLRQARLPGVEELDFPCVRAYTDPLPDPALSSECLDLTNRYGSEIQTSNSPTKRRSYQTTFGDSGFSLQILTFEPVLPHLGRSGAVIELFFDGELVASRNCSDDPSLRDLNSAVAMQAYKLLKRGTEPEEQL